MSSNDNRDLPLHSLNSDFIVEHYLLTLQFQDELDICRGIVHTFITPSPHRNTNLLILDLKDIAVVSVSKVDSSSVEIDSFLRDVESKKSYDSYCKWVSKLSATELKFSIEKWCIKIQTGDCDGAKLVRIEYTTTSKGNSLSRIRDGDGGFCCITTGSLINNRSLFPYQDAPTLMSTWQLVVNVSSTFTVLSTGDEQGVSTNENNQNGMYFYTQTLLPLSTFALAIGKWCCIDIDLSESMIPCKIYSSRGMDVSKMKDYIPSCSRVVSQILGKHPVKKYDFLIVPKLVAYLGLASPGLIFISPSILYGNDPLLERLGHEISHSWFGISLGPKNWNEEWMSEGFATFFEDIIQLRLSEKTEEKKRQLLDLKLLNRFQILKWDCANVDESLQCLASKTEHKNEVKNGLNPQRMVSQIPYLKGYFFLMELSSLVGLPPFLLSLKKYVERFHGCLISTEECVAFFTEEFHDKHIEMLSQTWLYSNQLPEQVISDEQLYANQFYIEVIRHFQFWKRKIEKKDRRKGCLQFGDPWARADQLVTLLDQLLEMPARIPAYIMKDIIDHYQPHTVNADVYHRTCELIVTNKYSDGLVLVEEFLMGHTAMGAYLYGELMMTDREVFKNVAVGVYEMIKSDLDADFSAIVFGLINS